EDDRRAPVVANFLHWLERIGARAIFMEAAAHDRAVAFTSHLPQLASTALATSIHGPESPVFGPGLLDMTRLALSSFDLWRDIFVTNQEPVADALTAYIDRLTEIRDALERRDVDALATLFESAQQLAGRLRQL